MGMIYCLFQNVKDRNPDQREADWQVLKQSLTKFSVRDTKDGKLWSPVCYSQGSTRGIKGVESVHALILDFDTGLDYEQFADDWREKGLEFVIHTTYSHSHGCPKWRAVFPLAYPVPSSDWPSVYKALSLAIGHGMADPSCKDASRIYYLPSHPPSGVGDSIVNNGKPIDPADYPQIIDDEPEIQTDTEPGLKPGDDFNARAQWPDILIPHGWQLSDKLGEFDLWRRPGKSEGHSARTGVGDKGDRFYCWSSSVPAAISGKLLTKFALYAILNHNGDYSEAARELRRQGYGTTSAIVQQINEGHPEIDQTEFHLTDLGNARRLVHLFGSNIRYCHLWSKWLVWDGKRWIQDDGGAAIRRIAHLTVDAIRDQALATNDTERRKELGKWAFGCETRNRIENMVAMAQTLEGIPVNPASFDSDPWTLNVLNGTVDLRTGELRPHRRDDMSTMLIEINYDENAPCPEWEKFIAWATVGRLDLADFLWRWFGYSCTGSTREQKFVFAHGMNGKNGKSTSVNTVARILGPYAKTTDVETLTLKAGEAAASNSLAALKGARMVVTTETTDGKRLNESLIKSLTGEDVITARFLYQEYFEFLPAFKITMFGNHKPSIRGTDDAIWRRVRMVPFDNCVADADVDKGLKDRLWEEREGILAWLVSGAVAWHTTGLTTPAVVTQATDAYRSESDALGAFLEECTGVCSGSSCRATKLYERYSQWCKSRNEYALTQTRFGRAMTERGHKSTKDRNGWRYEDLEILEEDLSHVYRGSSD